MIKQFCYVSGTQSMSSVNLFGLKSQGWRRLKVVKVEHTPAEGLSQELLLRDFVVIWALGLFPHSSSSAGVMLLCRSARERLCERRYGEMMPVGSAHTSWQQRRLFWVYSSGCTHSSTPPLLSGTHLCFKPTQDKNQQAQWCSVQSELLLSHSEFSRRAVGVHLRAGQWARRLPAVPRCTPGGAVRPWTQLPDCSLLSDLSKTLRETSCSAETVRLNFILPCLVAQQASDSNNKTPRLVTQLHFTSWPDFGVPFSPIGMLKFLKKVKAVNPPFSGPILVHCRYQQSPLWDLVPPSCLLHFSCIFVEKTTVLLTPGYVPPSGSAGVGRTGTFIVIDAMIDMMHAEQKVDVFGFVARIREQRSQLIQTDVSLRLRSVRGRCSCCLSDAQSGAVASGRGDTSANTEASAGSHTLSVCETYMVE